MPLAWLLAGTGLAVASVAVSGTTPAIPKIEAGTDWQISAGCQVRKFGILTEPDCDILTGEGIAIQITRFRVLSLPPGQDDRPVIGIELQPERGEWQFSSPFAALLVAGKSYSPAAIDQALVFTPRDRPIFQEKLPPDQQRYALPLGQKRFFRLRFPVPQSELAKGFELRVTGLRKEGEAVRVPVVRFE